ncbi:MAG: SpaH/EbpB family LPXTG-anchored major pilin [Clostridiales bacterium]|nr:SpaH/EbpB family LPXTG-anchored major pilin [Clostridiales bacterium]
MSKLKKFAGILLALVMCFGLTCTAFADDIISEDKTYSITITNANEGETYAAYKIFDAVYSGTNVTYYIDDEDAYYTYVAANAVLEEGALFTLVETGTSGYYQVVLNDGMSDSDVVSFFTNLGALGSASAQDTAEGTSLTLYPGAAGYYFVTTTTGSVVTINSAYPAVNITDKNSEPTVEKEETTDGTAGIGDTVEYKATITAAEDATTLVYHDVMSSGLTFDDTSVSVSIGGTTVTNTAETIYYTMTCTGLTDGCTFEVEFTTAALALITSDTTEVVITYSATVNENAIIDGTNEKGKNNSNTGSVSYGDNGTSTESTVYTDVYDIDIYKYTTGSDNNKVALPGAKFVLYKEVNGTKYYATVADGKLTRWDTENGTTLTSDENGAVSVDGLDAGTYYLEETEAPAGYNQLSSAITVVISEAGEVTYSYGSESGTGTVNVLNNAGSALPSTGGIGTTIFYVVGGVLVVGAVVLLITKKRMSE